MRTIETIKDGVSCSAVKLDDGWLGAVKIIDDVDEQFVEPVQRGAVLVEGKGEADWSDAAANLKRRMLCVRSQDGRITSQELSQADRISGFAVAGGEQPAIVWCERQGKLWRMMLWDGAEAKVVLEREGQLAFPTCAWISGTLLLTCEYVESDVEKVGVFNPEGKQLFDIDGRRGRLVGANEGNGFLIVERVEDRDTVRLHVHEVRNGALGREVPLPQDNDYSFNAHAAFDDASETLYVTYEACPGWNLDHRLGRHRDICLYSLQQGDAEFRPFDGSSGGVVPLVREAYWDLSWHNLPTIFPRVFVLDGRPALAYRRIYYGGHRSYGWFAYVTRFDGNGWTDPARISEHVGFADVGWEVLALDNELLTFLPSCDATPAVTHTEAAAGHPFTRQMPRSRKASNFRVEIVSCAVDEDLGGFEYPTDKLAPYVIPPRIHGICPDPPELDVPDGLQLVWGDLHPHTVFSKCMSYDDGFPQDVLRYQRDVLGCRVLCVVDHGLPLVEHTHVYDWLETEAGDRCVAVYGIEAGPGDAHHINTYAIDRETFDRVRVLLALHKTQDEVFPGIKRQFPMGSVLPARHVHGNNKGEFGIRSARTVELFDADLEVAMEAMQLRGDNMTELNWRVMSGPLFPNNFLNAGARISLLGGTDHANPPGPNHFCLTGFWVDELTPQAIFDAIRNHKTLAVSNAKTAIYPTLEGKPLGEEVDVTGAVRVSAQVSAGTKVERVCLMRDGELLDWVEVGAKKANVELVDENPSTGYHWYVVTAQTQSVIARQPALAHASPFFVNVR